MRNLILGLVILSIIFVLVSFKNFTLGQVNKDKVEMIRGENIEKFMKRHMEKVMDEVEKLGEEMNKPFRAWGRINFFTLTPSNQVMAGGVLENVTSSGFTLNTNNFKTNWVILNETKIVGPQRQELSPSDLQDGAQVRIKGKWDGQNLVAEIIIVFRAQSIQPAQLQRIQNLFQQVINMLKERGVDVTSILQGLQTATSSQ